MSLNVEKVKLATTKSFIVSSASYYMSNSGFYLQTKKLKLMVILLQTIKRSKFYR